jgi:hypothetical protein
MRDHDSDRSRLTGWAARIGGQRRPVGDRELERLGSDLHADQLARARRSGKPEPNIAPAERITPGVID